MKHKDEFRKNGRRVVEKDKSWEKWEKRLPESARCKDSLSCGLIRTTTF
jgi:hypothetical protein